MISPVEKNKEYVVDIVDNGFEGEGIAKIDGFTIFIPNAIKGEKIRILIVKVLSSHAFGKIIEIIEKSEHRIEEDCTTYKRCGGCNLRHIDYEETLNMKQRAVQNLVNKSLKNKVEVKPTWRMGNPYHYRNKLQYPIGIDKNGNAIVGVFANRTHEIIPVENCLIQESQANKIAKYLTELINKYKISVYNETTQKGLVRHVVIKTGFRSREVMVIIVINGDKLPFEKEISNQLQEKYEEIKSIVININNKNTNVILGEKNINILGDGYIKDYLGEYCFKISPLSFYQVNPVQAEALYNIAIENVNITPDDVVFDLYCGIGTISLFAAKYAKKVYGIEIVEQAIEDAKENAKMNNIQNTEFIAGDAEVLLTDLIENKKIIPDVVIVDPPRRGLDNITINNILKIHPKRVAYVSCNPATLVRDLSLLEEKYEIKMIQPVDMFPFTSHVECVCVLELKKSTEK
ncbi:MAG: 23S rRNA (uracil(1939)-C(5))-methyltransferase RlmD [Clostridia bacterium]|nr:23S rRNA (uracil(1939)-C(5))-methyltransferase RlmD [Clostridia bacterium]